VRDGGRHRSAARRRGTDNTCHLVIVWSYFRLQRHRADAVAMAHYRKLAEEAVVNQQELRAQLAELTAKVSAVEQLMREVG